MAKPLDLDNKKALQKLAAVQEFHLMIDDDFYFGKQKGIYIIAPGSAESRIGWKFDPLRESQGGMFRRTVKPYAWPTGTTNGDILGIIVCAGEDSNLFSLYRTLDTLPSLEGLVKLDASACWIASQI